MTASAAVADDVTQDVFMVVMRDAGRYQATRASVVAWLLGIARNHVRRRAERERFLQPVADLDEAAHPWPRSNIGDPLVELTRVEQIAILRRMVAALPVRYREAIVLCDLQELSYLDAAAALGCAVGTLRSRLHRARALLAEKMRDPQSAGEAAKLRSAGCLA
jgi:RNA polymerase sigma-70 factor (ECF subfamily)